MGLRQSRETSLVVSCATGDLSSVEATLNDPEIRRQHNLEHPNTPLVDAPSDDGDFPLSVASAHGHMPVVALLLARGAQINRRDGAGLTPLMCAIIGEQWRTAQYLVSQPGLDVNVQSHSGSTALMLAARHSFGLVASLVALGARLDLQDDAWRSALLYAADANNREIAEYLIVQGANWLIRNKDGDTAANLLGRQFVFQAVEKRRREMENLLKQCIKCDDLDELERLSMADEMEELEWIEIILEYAGDGTEGNGNTVGAGAESESDTDSELNPRIADRNTHEPANRSELDPVDHPSIGSTELLLENSSKIDSIQLQFQGATGGESNHTGFDGPENPNQDEPDE